MSLNRSKHILWWLIFKPCVPCLSIPSPAPVPLSVSLSHSLSLSLWLSFLHPPLHLRPSLSLFSPYHSLHLCWSPHLSLHCRRTAHKTTWHHPEAWVGRGGVREGLPGGVLQPEPNQGQDAGGCQGNRDGPPPLLSSSFTLLFSPLLCFSCSFLSSPLPSPPLFSGHDFGGCQVKWWSLN